MKFYQIFIFVMIGSTSYTKAKTPVYRARYLKKMVPVLYSPRVILPTRRCLYFETKSLLNCLNSTQYLLEYLFRHHAFNSAHEGSKINFTKKPIAIFRKNQASKMLGKLHSPYVNKYQIDKLNEAILRRTTNHIIKGHLHAETDHPLSTRKFESFDASADLPNTIINTLTYFDVAELTKILKDMEKLVDTVGNVNSSEHPTEIPLVKAETVDSFTDETYKNTDNVVNTHKVIVNSTEDITIASSEEKLMPDAMGFDKHNILPPENKNNIINQNDLIFALEQFERRLYLTNFLKFLSLTPLSKGDSGMSFVQSGLFLEMALVALSTEVDPETKHEIDQNLALNVTDLEKVELIKQVMSLLPNSSEELKFRRAFRLVLRSGRQPSQKFSSQAAKALQLKIEHFEDPKPEIMAKVLNRMIEEDSGGAIRDTFEEDDLSENEEAVLISTLYFRARWRTAPTLLNETRLFQVLGTAPLNTIKMIRVNDIMKYVDLPEWDAEAIEIPYLTEGLSLLMLVPRGNSLKSLVDHVTNCNLTSITERMQNIRLAVSLPLYTLRMTLLLPNKLEAMGIRRIVNTTEAGDSLRITQAVQRIMFWAEAGRNAFKDDGIEWDESPEMEMIIDRPYMFYVRWHKLNLIVGNFVL